jgi:hypothetical protein
VLSRVGRIGAWGAVLAGGFLLAGCGGSDVASYLVDGTSDQALTVMRDKAYAWNKSWEVAVVLRRKPDCQRRHPLQKAGDGDFRLEVYRNAGGELLLHQGQYWYLADLNNCELQQAAAAPAEAGEPIGTFETRGGPLTFVAAAAPAAAAPDQPAVSAGGDARP